MALPRILITSLALLGLTCVPGPGAPALAAGPDLILLRTAQAAGEVSPAPPAGHGHGHGGGVERKGPPLPFFVNFDTGANVKALAMHGRDLWLGLGNGLIRYNVDSYDDHTIYTVDSTGGSDPEGKPMAGLLSNAVFGLDVGPDGALWVSTHGGGLTRFKDGAWRTYTPLDGLGDRWVYDVAFAPDGTMWVATWKGLSRFDGERFTTYTEADGLADKWVYALAVDPDGTVWAGTEGGVSVFDGKGFTNYAHKDGLGAEVPETERKPVASQESRHHRAQGKANDGYNPNYVMAIATTPDGAKWFGTWGAGLSRFDGKKWSTHTVKDGLGGNFVHALTVAPDGTLWAATDGGASYLKDGAWITMDTRHGLIDDNVFAILFDKDGNVWLGTWRGLSKMTTPPPLPVRHLPPSPHRAPASS